MIKQDVVGNGCAVLIQLNTHADIVAVQVALIHLIVYAVWLDDLDANTVAQSSIPNDPQEDFTVTRHARDNVVR